MAEYRKITNLRPRIHSGNTRTVPPGDQAQVNVRGNSADPFLDFRIPQGEVGATPQMQIGHVRPVTEDIGAAAHLRGTAENPILDLDLPRSGFAAPDVAPTDESVADLVQTGGTLTNDAVIGTVTHQVEQQTAGLVQGQGLRRIVVSKNAEEPIGDGDLLLLVETPTFFEDFHSSTVGDHPLGWTPRWIYREGGYSVIEVEGRKVFQASWSGTERRAMTWDALDAIAQEYGDVEVVFKWRPENNRNDVSSRALTHGSGSPNSETGYIGGRAGNAREIAAWLDQGASRTSTSDPFLYPENGQWWVTRTRVEEGVSVRSRSWRHGFPEPSEWSASINIGSRPLSRGWIGLVSQASGRTQYDWMGVAFDGGRAPMGA